MSDFVNDFWSVYIVVLTVAGLIFCVVLLMAMSTQAQAGRVQSRSCTDTCGTRISRNTTIRCRAGGLGCSI